MNNTAIVTKLRNVRKHPNADKLQLATVIGTTIVVGMDVKDGDLGIYFDSNLCLSLEFCKHNNLYSHSELNLDKDIKGYFNDNGRVKCIKLRGELSDGFYCLISNLNFTGGNLDKLVEGYEFNSFNGIKICEKYIIKVKESGKSGQKRVRKLPNTKMFVEHFNTDQFMKNKNDIPIGSIVYISEKEHGTSGRYGRSLVKNKRTWLDRILGKPKYTWKYLVGSRRVLIDCNSEDPYFKDDMRSQISKKLNGLLKKGEQLYVEIVGYDTNGSFIQKDFPYGCKLGEYDVMLYRVTMNNEDGMIIDMSREYVSRRAVELGLRSFTDLGKFYYDGDMDKLTERVIELAQGKSVICSDTIREGVVLWFINNKGFWQALKYKSDAFKLTESRHKDQGIVDIEDDS